MNPTAEGRTAYQRGDSIGMNPHTNDPEYSDWIYGWMMAENLEVHGGITFVTVQAIVYAAALCAVLVWLLCEVAK